MAGFICEFCRKVFTLNTDLKKHHRLYHAGPPTSYKYMLCNKYFSNQSNYQQHTSQHSKIGDGGETIDTVNCTDCSQHITKPNWHHHVRTNAHIRNCADKIRNDDNGVNINDHEVKCALHILLIIIVERI